MDAGSPRAIEAVPLHTEALTTSTQLVLIGHPSGLPRKYADDGAVDAVRAQPDDCVEGEQEAAECSWEGDSACDVPIYCPEGTDLADCGGEDSEELRAARTPLATPEGYCSWVGYTVNVDSFAGNSGSGVFKYEV
eukprot:SAG11_NODE_6117_length_1385_cov_1.160964_2_plen_134_part_01